ncbi:Eco57I restriction-modification methylase domain-containing protein [Sphingomonas yantingensis]|uniref:site-specific DNA-methyltransferase (adenine-specific) n=1 Tax=Sphingomonas yantingensis TaxID=1241761 RepID=A0A7W9AT61_9SPHN|nr:Eco57I restriction-modification methylase domain-containing protein [Sphingomonas yantingensis]MBB5699997.1 adenine-specific DNA-methyltransferase [Sphingomonas yantingensis]
MQPADTIDDTNITASARADQTRLEISPGLDVARRSKLGQFMTPAPIASRMAQMFGPMPRDVRLLDAGAGIGALTAAFVTEALARNEVPRSITVTCFEVDEAMAAHLARTLHDCAVACAQRDVAFQSEIVRDDYVLASAEPLLARAWSFNRAILNPPYAKINTTSPWRLALRSAGIETVNLYSAFVALAVNQLDHGGELVAITPRSFCNGPYYEPFRRHLLANTALLKLLVFESRKKAFADDDVLQENVIFHVRRDDAQPIAVRLETDLGCTRDVPIAEVVRPGDPNAFIRLAISNDDAALAEKVQALPCTLAELGIKVSTGRVVDFRAKEQLRKDAGEGTAPLIYPGHMKDGGVVWPIADFKKHNAILIDDHTRSQLVPSGRYVLTKRFSAKEERRRIVASVYEATEPAGIENHLNYFHEAGAGLPADLAIGLAAFLNSTAVDDYFRLFSGHTQVNATDLRNLHYPTRVELEQLGRVTLGDWTALDDAVGRILARGVVGTDE